MTRTQRRNAVDTTRGHRWTVEAAEGVLTELANSGSSVHAFARERGLSPQRIYYWRQRLESVERATAEPQVEFTPVVLTGTHRRGLVTVRAGDVEVEVMDPSRVEPTWVAALVMNLERR